MEIKNMKNKVKIIFEYSKKIVGFGNITRGNLDKLELMVFLKDGTKVYNHEIKQITFKINRLID